MKREIRQNGKTVLYSGDGHSIPMIFNNLVGKNLKGREYSDYIAFVAIPDMGFTYGKIAYYSDGKPNRNGGNHAITSPPLCFIAGSPGRVAIRPDFFFTHPWERIDPIFGRTSFSFGEPWAGKDKEAKRNPLTHRIFSQAPHSFFSKPTGKNGQVARLNLTVLRAISTPSGRIPRKSLA